MIKAPGQNDYQYNLLAVDVKGMIDNARLTVEGTSHSGIGHSRVYLENAEAMARAERKKSSKLFGIPWR